MGTYSPFIDSILEYVSYVDHIEKVIDYVNRNGDWDMSKSEMWFHPLEIDRIVSVLPPQEERGEDKFYWKPSTAGCLSTKSAYHFFIDIATSADSIWRHICR